jgi:hypothetical protein
MSKNTVHLFLSRWPIRNGETVCAKCGHPVEHLEIVPLWDDIPVNTKMELPALKDRCDDCWRLARKAHKGPVKLYGVSERGKRDEERENR